MPQHVARRGAFHGLAQPVTRKRAVVKRRGPWSNQGGTWSAGKDLKRLGDGQGGSPAAAVAPAGRGSARIPGGSRGFPSPWQPGTRLSDGVPTVEAAASRARRSPRARGPVLTAGQPGRDAALSESRRGGRWCAWRRRSRRTCTPPASGHPPRPCRTGRATPPRTKKDADHDKSRARIFTRPRATLSTRR